jgi:hypothetical protein
MAGFSPVMVAVRAVDTPSAKDFQAMGEAGEYCTR